MIPPKPKILAAQAVSCLRDLPGATPSRLCDVSVGFDEGTLTILAGTSASGKNLLLRILGLFESPDAGVVSVNGAPTDKLSEQERTGIRNQYFGFLFADPFLLSAFSALENVAMPFFKVSTRSTDEARQRTEAMLAFVGMAEQTHACAGQLSTPAQQRVALARALVNKPRILLVENIDSNLRDQDLAQFAELVQRAVSELGVTAIVTASSANAVNAPDRVLEFADGRIQFDSAATFASGGSAN